MGSYAFLSHLPRHGIPAGARSAPSGAKFCDICGLYAFPEPRAEDLNVLNFERQKWGGVRHLSPVYAWFVLSQFERAQRQAPTEQDREHLRQILRICQDQPKDARPNTLAKALAGSFRSNEAERRVLIEILAICGVLHPRDHGNFSTSFTPQNTRAQPPEGKNDWTYPASFWRGSDGVNAAAVPTYFPDL